MKDTDFNKLVDMAWVGGGFIAANSNAEELANQCQKGEIISFLEVTKRDLKFLRCYFALLAFIWGYMPPKFKQSIPKEKFYQWLKHLKGQYAVIFEFKDGTKMVEYDSIAFGNMSEKRFRAYVAKQLPFIYTNVIGAYFEGEIYDNIIFTIEEAFERFMSKL